MMDYDKKKTERLRKKVYALQLYYGKLPHLSRSLTQNEIAKQLGTSTSQISLLIKEAYQEGLVEVSIHAPREYVLEEKLVHIYRRYGLRHARVAIAGNWDDEDSVVDAIGDCAARYFEDSLKAGSKVGIGGGITMRSLVDHLRPGTIPALEIYSMESSGLIRVCGNTLSADIAAKNDNLKASALPVPPLMGGTLDEVKDVLDYFLGLEPIAELCRHLKEIDTAIFGIGGLNDPVLRERDADYYGVDLSIIEEISKKAVGSILWQFFDENGNPVYSELHHRVISVELDQIRDMTSSPDKMVIAVAGGRGKVKAIEAAIMGGFVSTLITDVYTAESLSKMRDSEI